METYAKPVNGLRATRTRAALAGTIPAMANVRKTLAANLNALMAYHAEELGTSAKLRDRAKVGGSTVDGARRGTSATSIDSVAAIAGVFGLQPYQLLIPGLDPRNPQAAGVPRNQSEFFRQLEATTRSLQEQLAEYKARQGS